MITVKVSPKFHVVLPKEIRKRMGIRAGRTLQVFQYENRIELVPVRPVREMRGFLKGIDPKVSRDDDRL